MELVNVFSTVTREQAKEYCCQVLYRFNVITQYLLENPKERLGNTLGDVADQMEMRDFCGNLRALYSTDVLDNLSSEGYKDLLLKCKTLSDNYHLKVRIPADVRVIGECIIEDFIEAVTTKAIEGIDSNLRSLAKEKEQLLTQAESINFNDSNETYIERAVLDKKEYLKQQKIIDESFRVIEGRERQGLLYNDKVTAEANAKIIAAKKVQDSLVSNNPLILHLSGNDKGIKVKSEIESIYNRTSKNLLKLKEMVIADNFPIWEFDVLLKEELKSDKYTETEKEKINEWYTKCVTDEKIKQLLLSLVPVGLTLISLVIPGGASLLFLVSRTVLLATSAVVSGIDATDSIIRGNRSLVAAKADLKLTEAQVDLLSEQDISEATFEFLGAIVNAGFIAFDVMDAVKAASLIRKCNLLAPDTRKLLKNSKRFGERAFQTLNLEQLNTLTPQFSEYFSGNIDFIVDMYTRLNKTSAYTLPDDLLKNVTKESENFDDFARFIGKNQNIASEEEKVEYIQKAFLMLSPSEKGKLTIPADAKYVSGFGPEGRVEYYWPNNLGLKTGTDAPIVSKKGEVMLPDEITRVGEMYGKNFSDGKYTYDELAIPYMYNESAFEVFKINKKTYVAKIDAIASGNIDELNKVLKEEGIPELSKFDFNDIKSAYKDFISGIPGTIHCNPKYGIKGTIAEWYSPDGKTRWFKGGKPQFVMPLSGFYLKKIGIIK